MDIVFAWDATEGGGPPTGRYAIQDLCPLALTSIFTDGRIVEDMMVVGDGKKRGALGIVGVGVVEGGAEEGGVTRMIGIVAMTIGEIVIEDEGTRMMDAVDEVEVDTVTASIRGEVALDRAPWDLREGLVRSLLLRRHLTDNQLHRWYAPQSVDVVILIFFNCSLLTTVSNKQGKSNKCAVDFSFTCAISDENSKASGSPQANPSRQRASDWTNTGRPATILRYATLRWHPRPDACATTRAT